MVEEKHNDSVQSLSYDKNRRQIEAGQVVRICTVASLYGDFRVITGEDGRLYFFDSFLPEGEKKPIEQRELVCGFYPGTLEILSP